MFRRCGQSLGPRPPPILLGIPRIKPGGRKEIVNRRIVRKNTAKRRVFVPPDQNVADIKNDMRHLD